MSLYPVVFYPEWLQSSKHESNAASPETSPKYQYQANPQGKGISQEKLALRAEIDRSYMSEVERCLANPSIEALLKIGNALEVNPCDLLQLGKRKP